ncbi:MAG: 5'-methylthioadenosine/S-adenosylhomocysteine nucleosidase [Anaerolineaceae bacterium]
MPDVIVILSADYEWQVWIDLHSECQPWITPFGSAFEHLINDIPALSMQGGWGKVSAAASTQWAIDHYHPKLIVNLGTCGGLEGRVERQAILLVEKTIQYDIQEQMTDPEDARIFYSSKLDLTWLEKCVLPQGVVRSSMFSADRDILPSDVLHLIKEYDARAADWESGAIAWVADRNRTPLIILRGVSDLVNPQGGESYGNVEVFQKNTRKIINNLAGQLPWWIKTYFDYRKLTCQA